jgi:hypothetical protein
MSKISVRAALAGITLAVVTAVAGFIVGSQLSGAVIRTGVASPAEGAVSVASDGWTYNVPLDVPWIDDAGVLHDGGRPACLATGITANVPIKFASVDVSTGGNGWRQVVWVDCRAT